MKLLFLGLEALDPAEQKVIEVFLRFSGRTPHAQWTFASDEPAHLVLCDEHALDGDTVSMALEPTLAPRVWLLAPGASAPGLGRRTLRRPLQIDEFAALLRAREVEIDPSLAVVAEAAPAPRPPAPPPAPVVVRVPENARSLAIINDRQFVYRLRKWPGSDLLRGRPKYVRMLGFLSNRPLSVARLILLSGVDEATCLELLTLLDRRRLLERLDLEPDTEVQDGVEPSAFMTEAVRTQLPATAPVVASRETVGGGLFQRLRKRLGLS